MNAKAIIFVLILIGALGAALVLTMPDRFASKVDLIERIGELEKALESSNQQIQAYRQKEAEYLRQISELQTANQQLENKHRRNLDELFK